jgi:DNA mismatch endonuclease, patch repair protein
MPRASVNQTAAKKTGARSRPVKKKKVAVSAKKKRTGKNTSYHMVRRSKKPKTSGLEKKVEQWLIDAGVPYQTQKAISRCRVDLFLTETKTCVEVNGCYFHVHLACRPTDADRLKPKQVRKRKRDKRRYKFIREAGYKLLLLWECDINKDPDTAREMLLEPCSGN